MGYEYNPLTVPMMSDIDREEQARQYKEQEEQEERDAEKAREEIRVRDDMEYDKMRDAMEDPADPPETPMEKENHRFNREARLLAATLHEIVASAIRHKWIVFPGERDVINESMDVLQKYKEGKL